MRILLLEDDDVQRTVLASWIESDGHALHCVSDGAAAIQALEREPFDLALLDWEVPRLSGLDVLLWARRCRPSLPVVFMTARGDEGDIASILDRGASDYLVKPARRVELLARLRALARRAGREAAPQVIDAPPYRIDVARATVCLHGQCVKLKPREAQVALLLFRRRGEVVSRQEILEIVWGIRADLCSRTVDTHVSQVRKRLGLDGSNGWMLKGVYQRGYRLGRVPAP